MVGELDTRPVTAETVLAFLDALIDGGNMPSAATPCGLPTGRAFHLVTHLPPSSFTSTISSSILLESILLYRYDRRGNPVMHNIASSVHAVLSIFSPLLW